MINRIGYAFVMAWQHRKDLRAYRREAALQREGVLACEPLLLQAQGIKVVALDVDGVLTPYGAIELNQNIGSWLNYCIRVFGEGNVFILTNKPTKRRINYFTQHFRGIRLLLPKRKKPYPDGLQEILQRTQIQPKELLVVDDRLLTGILAAIIAKASGCYITKPLICLKKRPLAELFFMGLRKIERSLL